MQMSAGKLGGERWTLSNIRCPRDPVGQTQSSACRGRGGALHLEICHMNDYMQAEAMMLGDVLPILFLR